MNKHEVLHPKLPRTNPFPSSSSPPSTSWDAWALPMQCAQAHEFLLGNDWKRMNSSRAAHPKNRSWAGGGSMWSSTSEECGSGRVFAASSSFLILHGLSLLGKTDHHSLGKTKGFGRNPPNPSPRRVITTRFGRCVTSPGFGESSVPSLSIPDLRCGP